MISMETHEKCHYCKGRGIDRKGAPCRGCRGWGVMVRPDYQCMHICGCTELADMVLICRACWRGDCGVIHMTQIQMIKAADI
jgi:hypothetical protein